MKKDYNKTCSWGMIASAIVPGRQVHKGVAVARQRRGSAASAERFLQTVLYIIMHFKYSSGVDYGWEN